MRGHADTFLAFVEDGRARMIDAVFFRVGEFLAAALVNALLCHFPGIPLSECYPLSGKEEAGRSKVVGMMKSSRQR